MQTLSTVLDGFTDREVQHLAGKELRQLRGAYADFACAIQGLAENMQVKGAGSMHEQMKRELAQTSKAARTKAKTGEATAWVDLALGVARRGVSGAAAM